MIPAKRRVKHLVEPRRVDATRARDPRTLEPNTRDPDTGHPFPRFPKVSRASTRADLAIVPQSQGYWMEESYLHSCFASFGETTRGTCCHLLCFSLAPRRRVAPHAARRRAFDDARTAPGGRPRRSDGRIARHSGRARPLSAQTRPAPPTPDLADLTNTARKTKRRLFTSRQNIFCQN